MHVENMARNESLHKQLETKEASIAILKKKQKKETRTSDDGGEYTNKRADIIDPKRGISGVNNPTTQRVITRVTKPHVTMITQLTIIALTEASIPKKKKSKK